MKPLKEVKVNLLTQLASIPLPPGSFLVKNCLLQFQIFVLQLNPLKITNVHAAHQDKFLMRIRLGVKNVPQTQFIQLHIGRI